MDYIKLVLSRIKSIQAIICFALGLFFIENISFAQFISKIYFAGGLSTYSIIGDNPATKPIVPRDSLTNILGGGFHGGQPGVSALFTFEIDKEGLFRIPIGYSYYYLGSAEKAPISRALVVYLSHDVYIHTISLGFNYVL